MAKIKIFILIFFYSLICISIYKTNDYQVLETKNNNEIIISEQKQLINNPIVEIDESIGYLSINKINLNKKLYPINNIKNNIEENITILPESIFPNQNDSIIFLAAHSGPAANSYFNDLNKLNINDEIILSLYNKNYIYIIKDIWETEKDGNIEIEKEQTNQLILTTCSTKNKYKQLVVNSTIKES